MSDDPMKEMALECDERIVARGGRSVFGPWRNSRRQAAKYGPPIGEITDADKGAPWVRRKQPVAIYRPEQEGI